MGTLDPYRPAVWTAAENASTLGSTVSGEGFGETGSPDAYPTRGGAGDEDW